MPPGAAKPLRLAVSGVFVFTGLAKNVIVKKLMRVGKYLRCGLYVFVTFILLLAVCYGLYKLMVSRTYQVFGELIYRVATEEKVVALTFDDGPTENTAQILEALEERDISATFYVVGERLNEQPDLGREIVEAGHALQNHSYTHKRMVLKSPGFVKKEIEQTDAAIREVGYEGVIDFRPPYGKKLFVLPWYLQKVGKRSILWDVEVSSEQSAESLASEVIAATKPGSIILLHPMYNQSDLEAIPLVVDALREDGYRFVTVPELLEFREE